MVNNLKLWKSIIRGSVLLLGTTMFLGLADTAPVYAAAPSFVINGEGAVQEDEAAEEESNPKVYQFKYLNPNTNDEYQMRFPLDVIIELELSNALLDNDSSNGAKVDNNEVEINKIEYYEVRNKVKKKKIEEVDKDDEMVWNIKKISTAPNQYQLIPDKILDPSSTYEIIIPNGDEDPYYIQVQTVYSLEDLIVDYIDEFNAMIRDNSFQGLDVLVPTQYITKGELTYTPISSENSEGDHVEGYFVNIDITASQEIEKIAVTFNEEFDQEDLSDGFINPWEEFEETTHTAISDGKKFNTGYVYDDDDIEKDVIITCWDYNDRIIDQRVVQFNKDREEWGEDQEVVSRPKRLREATLYDLITKTSRFEDYLEQFTLDKIYINPRID